MTTLENRILRVLKTNKNKWVTNRVINGTMYHWYKDQKMLNPMTIRASIRLLRACGCPIVAGHKGYKLTTSPKEVKQYVLDRKSEIMAELKVLINMEGKIKNGRTN